MDRDATDWAMDTTVVLETVRVTKKFLIEHPEELTGFKPREYKVAIAGFLGGVFNDELIHDPWKLSALKSQIRPLYRVLTPTAKNFNFFLRRSGKAAL